MFNRQAQVALDLTNQITPYERYELEITLADMGTSRLTIDEVEESFGWASNWPGTPSFGIGLRQAEEEEEEEAPDARLGVEVQEDIENGADAVGPDTPTPGLTPPQQAPPPSNEPASSSSSSSVEYESSLPPKRAKRAPVSLPKPVPGSKSTPTPSIPKSKPKTPCPYCAESFTTLNTHINSVHRKLRPYECEYCQRVFAERSKRDRHVRGAVCLKKGRGEGRVGGGSGE
ncbi:hypothetical protein BKA65DRAFT_558506 [Rhexocercosporidium sp. MPI-PUGE-AT-0058]|nr:hypothetical protein BKA65DRAFT_558506 [Rhexocercosporidium sp. MPI-PUGE-AT-0058]